MPDMLERGSTWLDEKRHELMTRTVTYRRGASSLDLAATIGRTAFETTDDFGVVQRTESRDFLVRATDLVLDGEPTLPLRGDRILEGGLVYEVMAPAGQPHFRHSDPYRRALRIHTKHVATEGGG